MNETTIIIPVADVVPDSEKLLESLLYSIESQNIHKSFPIMVCFDNCSKRFVEHFLLKYPFIDAVINTGNNLNFSGNVNNGLRKVYKETNNNVLVVNQDCILPAHYWLTMLTSREGLCVPNPVQVCKEPPVDQSDLEILYKSQPSEIVFTPQIKLVGFCTFMSRKGLDKVGFLDPYFKAGFDDDDLCARYVLAGLPVEHVNINVNHYVSRCGAYDMRKLGLALAKFRLKWQIPKEIEHGLFNQWIIENHVWDDKMREE